MPGAVIGAFITSEEQGLKYILFFGFGSLELKIMCRVVVSSIVGGISVKTLPSLKRSMSGEVIPVAVERRLKEDRPGLFDAD